MLWLLRFLALLFGRLPPTRKPNRKNGGMSGSRVGRRHATLGRREDRKRVLKRPNARVGLTPARRAARKSEVPNRKHAGPQEKPRAVASGGNTTAHAKGGRGVRRKPNFVVVTGLLIII